MAIQPLVYLGYFPNAVVKGFYAIGPYEGLATAFATEKEDALLYAAASDLRAVCEAAIADYEQGITPDFPIREMMRSAIAKANGETVE